VNTNSKSSAIPKTDINNHNNTQSDLQLPQLKDNYQELVGTKRRHGIDQANYSMHAKARQGIFFTWIQEYIKMTTHNNDTTRLPNILCSSGLVLSYLLCTPTVNSSRWDFYATKIENSILMWTEPNDHEPKRLSNAKPGVKFEGFVTGFQGENMWEICNNKNWIVRKTELGKFTLLFLNDVDGIEKDGSWVELKLYNKRDFRQFKTSNKCNIEYCEYL